MMTVRSQDDTPPEEEGKKRAVEIATKVQEIGGRGPLLVVLDGPEYQRQMRLVALLRRLVARGEIRPHRAVLVTPEDRLETYSASAAYAKALAQTVDALAGRGRRRPVGIGASLGGLALLHAHRVQPDAFGGLLLQSGSYFTRKSDPQEARFGRFGRVDRFVGSVLRGRGTLRPVPATITCALDEENYANNAAVARALAEQDYPVEFHAARGGHDWPTWRRALEVHLPPLLRRVWR